MWREHVGMWRATREREKALYTMSDRCGVVTLWRVLNLLFSSLLFSSLQGFDLVCTAVRHDHE